MSQYSSGEAHEASGKPRGTHTRRYGPRTCRICLDVEQPQYTGLSSRPQYISADPELGRLLSPCKCKGSQKYVHEGCLNSWRLANPSAKRNYWQCPTCKFSYRLARLHWASMLSSRYAQAALTVVIMFVLIFFLGFMADPIYNLWLDPLGTIRETVTNVVTDIEAMKPSIYEEPATWSEHFVKGFFSLGIVGIFKSFIASGPWGWWQLRWSGRRQGNGRARVENIGWVFVVFGVITALTAIWKGVKKGSEQILRTVSDSVLDIGGEEDDDFEEETNADHKKNQ